MMRLLFIFLLGFAALAQKQENNLIIRTNLTVLESADLTGTTLSGTTRYDGADESNVTISGDYGLGLAYSLTDPPALRVSIRSVQTLEYLRDSVEPDSVNLFATVDVQGRATAGDGGGGQYRKVAYADVAGDGGEGGVWVQSTMDPTYAWLLVLNTDQLTSHQWGLLDGTDDLVAMQAWIDYTAANNLTAFLDDGSYILTNSLVIPSNLQLVGTYNSVFERAAVTSQTNHHNYSALRTAYTFNPYLTNGGFEGSTVPGYVTNVVLQGFRLKTAAGYVSSFGIAAFAAQNWLLSDLTVDTMTNHWAITYFGNQIRTEGCVINNQGAIYQDGLHVIGGDSLVFTGNIVNSGDDSYAMTTGYYQQTDISNVTISGNVANSSHAHAVRIAIENDSGTNRIYNIVVNGMTGSAGLEKNALVRFESNSTNVADLYGITNISLSNIRLVGGTLADHGGVIAGADYGYHIHNADNVVITDCHVGTTPLWNYYLADSGRITLTDCTGEGAQWTNLNATIWAGNVDSLTINGGHYRNSASVDSDTLQLIGVGRALLNGVYLENSYTNRAALALAGDSVGTLTAIGTTFTNALGYSFLSYVNPDELILVGNIFGSPQGVLWESSTPPTTSVIANNLGLSGTSTASAINYEVVSATGGYLGGMDSYATRIRFTGTNGMFVFGQDNLTGATKISRVGSQPYAETNKPVTVFVASDTGASRTVTLGGGTSLMNSPSIINLATAATDYEPGTNRVRITDGGVVIEPGDVASNAAASEAFAVRSTSKGSLLNVMTAAQFDAISSKSSGLLGTISDVGYKLGYYSGSARVMYASENDLSTIQIPASAFTPFASGGATAVTTTLATTLVPIDEYSFSASVSNRIAFKVTFPPGWNGTTLTARFNWRTTSASANDVKWQIVARYVGNGVSPDVAFGTAATVTDTNTGAEYLNISGNTGTITPSGSFVSGCSVHLVVFRDPTDGSDTLASAALLDDVILTWK